MRIFLFLCVLHGHTTYTTYYTAKCMKYCAAFVIDIVISLDYFRTLYNILGNYWNSIKMHLKPGYGLSIPQA